MRFFSMQLKDLATGQAIITAGGKVYVAVNGAAQKQALVNADGSTLSNPITPTRGKIEFHVADDTVTKVDLYGIAPGGQAFQLTDVTASGPNEIGVDTSRRDQVLVIPFAIGDTSAATETDTGFVEPASAIIKPTPFVRVSAIDATETLDIGTLSTDSGDANGFVAAASVGTLGVVKGSLANGAVTMGALLFVQDSANAGDAAPEGHVSGGKAITYTLTAGSDTAKGFIHLPYTLAA